MEFNKTLESILACHGICLPYLPRNNFCWRQMHLHGSNAQDQIMGSTSSMYFGDVVEAFRDASF